MRFCSLRGLLIRLPFVRSIAFASFAPPSFIVPVLNLPVLHQYLGVCDEPILSYSFTPSG